MKKHMLEGRYWRPDVPWPKHTWPKRHYSDEQRWILWDVMPMNLGTLRQILEEAETAGATNELPFIRECIAVAGHRGYS